MKTLFKIPIPLFLTALTFALLGIGFVPKTQAVTPAPDGGYPGENTAEGLNALLSRTSGSFNAAIGWNSLRNLTSGNLNTAVGAGTLFANTGDENTATGTAALLFNTIGAQNTANGAFALFKNTSGNGNTANGVQALSNNTSGFSNTANGANALLNNTTGGDNVAIGVDTLLLNTTGVDNVAIGLNALNDNTTGGGNVAIGGSAGFNQTTGNNNIYIGFENGVAGESNTCYIASIFGQTSVNGIPVLINSNDQLGTTTSSKRFKEDIKPMEKASDAILALKPVTFHYKKEIDPAGTAQFGLVAEDVEKVNPALVVRDKDGKPYSVRYDQVNAMLLNEFLKARRQIDVQQKQIDALTAGLQKVSAQLELSKPAPQTVLNSQ